ncbi:helix-turn-helix transcriptional regulator [Vagococcus salmoninarum]|uniref:helix-turn-helix transcriptional regulator n=1 Tax=Vagococcus salmoninarum TaxID=2739 RepID=UPI003F94F9DB
MKISRIVSIITILLDKKRISAQELAELFEVSLRTIYRDIDAINLAGIPIHATPGVGGGFEIMENYKITNNVFSATDLSTILIGLSGLTNMVESEELINTLVKVKSFIPVEREADISLKTNQIQIDLSQWQTDRNV